MSLWLRWRWVLCRTLTFKNKTKTTLQSCFSGCSSHIQRCFARGFWLRHSQYWKFLLTNWKKRTTNRDATMAVKLTCEWGTTKVQFQSRMHYHNRANYNFLKCLYSGRPLDNPHNLKCLPNISHNLKCLLNRRVTINFPPIFGYNLVSSEFGQYFSSPTLLGDWLMLARWFAGCCLLLFDSIVQSWGPGVVVGPLCACSLVCCLLLALVCFNFARLGSYIRSWTYCWSLHGRDSASMIGTMLLSFPIHR